MSDAVNIRRLRHTPFRDLVRGRVTGRLDWRARIAAAGLPGPLAAIVAQVARRTRLWRTERVAVADELIAHFADGLAAGATADALASAFGDPRLAARLIRRAKRRDRPLAWHALKWARRGLAVLLALYAAAFARFLFARPTVSVDYVAKLNAFVAQAPPDGRAWPIYREALIATGRDGRHHAGGIRSVSDDARVAHPLDRVIDDAETPESRGARTLVDAVPADAAWPELTAWLDGHAAGVELARRASAKPAMGFVYGPLGSQADPELGWTAPAPAASAAADDALINVPLPTLSPMRTLVDVLLADARYAEAQRDGARAAADLIATLDIARHQDAPFAVARLVGMKIYRRAFDGLERSLAATPELFGDAQLVALAHRVSQVGGDAPASLVDLAGERWSLHDLVQRAFSDAGGSDDGALTVEGMRFLHRLLTASPEPSDIDVGTIAFGSAASLVSSRRDTLAELDRQFAFAERALARPLRHRAADEASLDDRVVALRSSPLGHLKHFVILSTFPSFDRVAETAEMTLGRREGVTVGIALELHRRRHGRYPTSLDALTPALLPRVPADRITGAPLRYALIDGRPVVYSVGVDRDDDGGRPPIDPRTRRPDPTGAAQWRTVGASSGHEGDWVLYDGRPRLPRAVGRTDHG